MTNQQTIAKTIPCGDFKINLQYIDNDPAMVLSASRFINQRRRAWVIPIEACWKYVDDVDAPGSGHSEYMVAASTKIAEMLGLGSDLKTRFRIAEAIVNNLEELINMPPGNFKPKVIADAVATLGDEEFCFEITDEPQATH